MSVLLGPAATAGLDASALGLTFCQIPAGAYEVGAAGMEEDNPVRQVELDAFELANTPTTNKQWAKALGQLGGRNTILMFQSVENRRWTVAARGTRQEIEEVSLADLREVILSRRFVRPWLGVERVGGFSVHGDLQAFNLSEVLTRIIPVTLVHRRLGGVIEGFDGDNQPTIVEYFEAAAVAALFGLILPTGEMWEAASGGFGMDERYQVEENLRKVAHLSPKEGTTMAEVGTKEPNRYGLYDMLGNVWEWMASPAVHGGDIRHYLIGCRFGRQDS